MRHEPLEPKLFTENRSRLAKLLPPKSIAVLNANDILPTNADGSLLMRANSDLFYLTGVEQEETLLVIPPHSPTPIPVLTVHGAAGAKAISLQ